MDEMELGMEALTEELADAAPEEEVVRNFATVGEVFEDGVSLIFDGEEEPTEKHYLCNTNVFFQAGDRVRILADGGTYIVEYVVGAPRQQPIHQVPGGGDEDDVLTKASGDSWDTEWSAPRYVPQTGTTGYVLTKTASGYAWQAAPSDIPSTGTTGYVLTKTATGFAWQAVPTEIPSSGTTGYVLTKTSSGNAWQAVNAVPGTGTTGHVLTKTNSGYAWQAAPSDIPSTGTSGYVLTKTATGFEWKAVPTELPSSGTNGHVLTKTSSGVAWQAISVVPVSIANLGVQSSLQTNNSYVIQLKTGGTSGTAASTFYIRMGTSGTWHQITTT